MKLIKFTFDVDKVFDQLKNNFSNLTDKVCTTPPENIDSFSDGHTNFSI